MMIDKTSINQFRGLHRFLSNFFPAPILYKGKVFPSSEHLFQALKTLDPEEREEIRRLPTPGEAKRRGRQVTIRENWDEVKRGFMKKILKMKFDQNPHLKERLLATGTHVLEEGNNWHDTYWGIDLETGLGLNILGRLIMELRSEYR